MLKKQKNTSLLSLFKDHPNKKEIIYLAKKDKDLKNLFLKFPDFPQFKRSKGFEGLVRLITEQQLSVASAKAIFLRIKKIIPRFSPEEFLKISTTKLQKTGLSGPKINYCRILANEIISGNLSFRSLHKLNDEKLKKRLCEIKGIGEWTAECYLLAALGRKDVWPVKDLGLQAALKEIKNLDSRPNEQEMSELASSWIPYRSIVANVLWASHD